MLISIKRFPKYLYSLHHWDAPKSEWSVEEVRKRRLELILNEVKEEEIMVIIDETGDRKKGNKTDYVQRKYIGNLGKIENGIVAVTAYGVIRGMGTGIV